MDPKELIRAKYLETHHLTEDDVSNMSPDQRAKVEQEIEDEIDRQMEAEIRRKHDESSRRPRVPVESEPLTLGAAASE